MAFAPATKGRRRARQAVQGRMFRLGNPEDPDLGSCLGREERRQGCMTRPASCGALSGSAVYGGLQMGGWPA